MIGLKSRGVATPNCVISAIKNLKRNSLAGRGTREAIALVKRGALHLAAR
jgi:hypothetical protein